MAVVENYTVKTLGSIKKDDWDQFVHNHKHGNIFQTSDMAEVYRRTKHYEPVPLAVVDSKDRIIAVLLAVVIKEIKGPLGVLSAHSRITGGPLYLDGAEGINALDVLFKHYDKIIRKKAIYSEIRNMWDTSSVSNTFENAGYGYEEHLNYVLYLNKPIEELWNGLTKSGRRSIRKGKNNDLVLEEIKDFSLIPAFHELMQRTFHNVKIPLADISLFESAFDVLAPKGMVRFFLIKYMDKYIAGLMALIYKSTIYEWYVTTNKNYLLFQGEILTWHIIEWGSKNGYDVFDFLGAGKPDKEYGVRRFKGKFGGELVNFGRYNKVHSQMKMKIAEKGFETYRRLNLMKLL